MHKKLIIGKNEKHTLDLNVNWFLGMIVLSVDGKALYRRPFFLKLEHSLEIGETERHLINLRFNAFDYFGNVIKLTVDGQDMAASMEMGPLEKNDTPVDDAAAALLFVTISHFIFSVIGTLFVPDLDRLDTRLMLLLGGMIYLWLFVKILSGSKYGLWIAAMIFSVDTAVSVLTAFSVPGLVVRSMILYYFWIGIQYQKTVLSRIR